VPRLTHDIFKRLASGRHRLELDHSGLTPASEKFETGLNRLTMGIVIAASLIAASLVLNTGQAILTLPIHVFGLTSLSITHLLGLAGYIIATVLGLWLIFSIFRSGKM